MAIISGIQTNAAMKVATTYGTAVSVGAGNKFKGEIDIDFGTDHLSPRQHGSGAIMLQSLARGNYKPEFTLTMDGGYRNCLDYLLALFFGTSAAPTEATGGQSDYVHSILLNSTRNIKPFTFAYETSSTTIVELPSCYVRSISIAVDDVPGILQVSAQCVANTVVLSGAVNSNATLAAATATDSEVIAYAGEDTFRMNLSSAGALAGGDQTNITSYTLNMEQPMEVIGEIRAAAGNGAPIVTGAPTFTLDLSAKQLDDHTQLGYWLAETALKCALNIQGTQIGSGTNKGITINLPKMLHVTEPKYSVASEGINPVTMSLQSIEATANPTGMSSKYPYVSMTNGLSTSLLA